MKTFLAFLFMCFSFVASADDDLKINVDGSKKTFVVTLSANPTTGFMWTLVSFDKTLFQLTGSVYHQPKTKLIGAGGQMDFQFRLIKGKAYPKNTKMVFKYARTWEPDTATIKNVIVSFVPASTI